MNDDMPWQDPDRPLVLFGNPPHGASEYRIAITTTREGERSWTEYLKPHSGLANSRPAIRSFAWLRWDSSLQRMVRDAAAEGILVEITVEVRADPDHAWICPEPPIWVPPERCPALPSHVFKELGPGGGYVQREECIHCGEAALSPLRVRLLREDGRQ